MIAVTMILRIIVLRVRPSARLLGSTSPVGAGGYFGTCSSRYIGPAVMVEVGHR